MSLKRFPISLLQKSRDGLEVVGDVDAMRFTQRGKDVNREAAIEEGELLEILGKFKG